MTKSLGHAQVPVPPPFVFLVYLMAALILNVLLPVPVPWPATAWLVGAVALVGGLLLGGFAASRMRKDHTPLDPGRPSTALVTNGPYRLTRNPIYLGFVLICLGFTLIAGTLWGILLAPFLLITVTRLIIRAEEAYLQARFKGHYGNYRSRVRQWL